MICLPLKRLLKWFFFKYIFEKCIVNLKEILQRKSCLKSDIYFADRFTT